MSQLDRLRRDMAAQQHEISMLDDVRRQLFTEINDLRMEQERVIYSQQLKGKFFNFMGYIFSVYCVYKMFMSTINIIFQRVAKVRCICSGVIVCLDCYFRYAIIFRYVKKHGYMMHDVTYYIMTYPIMQHVYTIHTRSIQFHVVFNSFSCISWM